MCVCVCVHVSIKDQLCALKFERIVISIVVYKMLIVCQLPRLRMNQQSETI